MTKKEALQPFEEKKIRSVWYDKEEKWQPVSSNKKFFLN